MTQFSWPWSCDNTGDGGPASFSLDVVQSTNRITSNLSPSSSGVVYWTDGTSLPFQGFINPSTGLLVPTNPSGNTIRIASGVGVVQGWLYANDDNVDFDARGAANATDIIVLRRDITTQTVRLALVQAGAGATATVTQSTTTWEVLIATIALDGSGNVSTLTDSRTLATPPVGAMIKIGEVTSDGTSGTDLNFSSIPNIFRHLKVIARASTTAAVNLTDISVNFNGNTSSYTYSNTVQSNSSVTNTTTAAGATGGICGKISGASGSGDFSQIEVDIYNSEDKDSIQAKKTYISSTIALGDGTAGANGITLVTSGGLWVSPSTGVDITQVTLSTNGSGNFTSGSRAILYGIA